MAVIQLSPCPAPGALSDGCLCHLQSGVGSPGYPVTVVYTSAGVLSGSHNTFQGDSEPLPTLYCCCLGRHETWLYSWRMCAYFSPVTGSTRLAQEALAGLASKENFSKVQLRKADSFSSSTPGAGQHEPYKDPMLLHLKGESCQAVIVLQPCSQHWAEHRPPNLCARHQPLAMKSAFLINGEYIRVSCCNLISIF